MQFYFWQGRLSGFNLTGVLFVLRSRCYAVLLKKISIAGKKISGRDSMKIQSSAKKQSVDKLLPVFILYFLSTGITFSGLFFAVYSFLFNVSFKIINMTVSGVIFGLAVLYLGIRYFFQVRKLKADVFKPSNKFSWSNFKRRSLQHFQ
jgi:hypothetical protein